MTDDRSPRTLIAPPESPYRVLDVAFDADARAINRAMRTLFRKDPRHGAVKGNRAQKQLTDPRERIREDALCVETDLPPLDLSAMGDQIREAAAADRCPPLDDFLLFSDLYFAPERLAPPLNGRDLPVALPYRKTCDRRPLPWDVDDKGAP